MTVGNAAFSASGETQVVLDAYADFKKYLEAAPTVAAADTRPPSEGAAGEHPAEQSEPVGTSEPPAEVKSPTALPLKPYLARLKLRGNKEKATAIIAWSAESGQKAALTLAEIEQLWKKTPFKAPSNLPRDVRNAEAEGWLESQGKAGSPDTTYSINGYGEGIVAGWVEADKE